MTVLLVIVGAYSALVAIGTAAFLLTNTTTQCSCCSVTLDGSPVLDFESNVIHTEALCFPIREYIAQ